MNVSKRRHTRVLQRKRTTDKSPEIIIIRTTTNNPVGKGILYPVHIKNAREMTSERKKTKKEEKVTYFKGIRSNDDPGADMFFLTEAETKASIAAYDMNEFLRPKIKEHSTSNGKNIDINFVREMNEYDNKTVDGMVDLLITYEGWKFKPANTNMKKLRKKLDKEG